MTEELGTVMPNICGPKEGKQRLLMLIAKSVTLFKALVWFAPTSKTKRYYAKPRLFLHSLSSRRIKQGVSATLVEARVIPKV